MVTPEYEEKDKLVIAGMDGASEWGKKAQVNERVPVVCRTSPDSTGVGIKRKCFDIHRSRQEDQCNPQ